MNTPNVLDQQPTNALDKIQFMTSVKLLHVLAPGVWHLSWIVFYKAHLLVDVLIIQMCTQYE